jgi:hypothetical protein
MANWREVFARAYVDAASFIGLRSIVVRALPAVLMPLFLWLQFGTGSVKTWVGIFPLVVSLVEAYVLAFSVVYLWKLVAAPVALLHERDAAIAERDSQIAKMNAELRPPSPFRTIIKSLRFFPQPDRNATHVHAMIEIRNLNAPETVLEDFTLHLVSDPHLMGSEIQRRDSFLTHGDVLKPGRTTQGGIMFEIPRISDKDDDAINKSGTAWQITFKDIHRKKHDSAIFTIA